jgi:hypothetical protein
MGLESCREGNKVGFSWNGATCYTGRNARELALRDGVYLNLINKRENRPFVYAEFSELDDQELSKYLSLVGANYEEAVVILAGRNMKNG